MRRIPKVMRVLFGALLCGFLASSVLAPPSSAAPAKAPAFATLRGEGSWSVAAQLVAWQNELASPAKWVDLNYISHGTALARQDLAAKQIDFAISGVPFSADELKRINGGANGLIAAPVQVATLAAFVEPPTAGFRTQTQVCDPDDETTWPGYPDPPPITFDPSIDCITKQAYNGAVRIPSRNLGAMFVHYVGPNPSAPVYAWNAPDVLSAFGLSNIVTGSPTAGPGFAGRSDPDEMNYYMQTFVKTAARDVWDATVAANPNIPWEPITERVGQVVGITRDGAEQQLVQLNQGGCGSDGSCSPSVAGGLAPAPSSRLKLFHDVFPNQPLTFADIKNGNGDWTAPAVDAINKAVDAGGAEPLYALTHQVKGAYPLVWVDNLYAPAHGLSVEKTEGLATAIRYLATTGQKHSTEVGEGRLPPALVTKSLAAANALVQSNCTGASRRIVTNTDPGPLAPSTATAMRSIGNMLHCEAVPQAPTTTVPPAGGGTASSGNSVDNSSFDNTSSGDSDSSSSASAANAPTDDTSSGDGADVDVTLKQKTVVKRTGLLVSEELPLPMPTVPTASDRLATFLLGAALFLLLRKPVGSLVKRVTS